MKKFDRLALALTGVLFGIAPFGLGKFKTVDAFCSKIGNYHNYGDNGTQFASGPCQAGFGDNQTETAKDFSLWLDSIIYPLAGFGVALAVVMVVFAGYLYVTSVGDEKALARAKTLLISSGIGVFVCLCVFIIGNLFASLAGFS